ncbi:hypothetical protein GCM10010271_29850 [Streptomyces kurssanovii]|nr:hypothetical protein GCM10010271_29850 [Streptomyces kurssanovii]
MESKKLDECPLHGARVSPEYLVGRRLEQVLASWHLYGAEDPSGPMDVWLIDNAGDSTRVTTGSDWCLIVGVSAPRRRRRVGPASHRLFRRRIPTRSPALPTPSSVPSTAPTSVPLPPVRPTDPTVPPAPTVQPTPTGSSGLDAFGSAERMEQAMPVEERDTGEPWAGPAAWHGNQEVLAKQRRSYAAGARRGFSGARAGVRWPDGGACNLARDVGRHGRASGRGVFQSPRTRPRLCV